MAQTSIATLPNILPRTYTRDKYFAPHERVMCKFYDSISDWPDGGKPVGLERRWGIRTSDSHAAGAVAESADLPSFAVPGVSQAAASVASFAASVAWSDVILLAGTGEGMLNGLDIVDDHVKMTTRNQMSALNRASLGHGSGRMAVIEATTDTLTTFVCRNPEHTFQLRVGMAIDFYDTDAGVGTKQGNTEKITAINFETRTVTIENARTLTAGWGVYKSHSPSGTASTTAFNEYFNTFKGLRAIHDDGTLSATLFGITRSATPAINATVLTAGGGTQAYSEKLVRKALGRVLMSGGGQIDEIWMNKGILGEHMNHLTGSRMFTVGVSDTGVPSYKIGQRTEEIGFQDGGKFIPFKIDTDLPDREFIGIIKGNMRRHVLRNTTWVGDDTGADGSQSPVLMQAPGGTNTYNLSKVAGLLAVLFIGNTQPKQGFRTTEVADEELAND